MKNLLIFLYLIFLFTTETLTSGELFLSKTNIVQSEKIGLKYNDTGRMFILTKPDLYIYSFSGKNNIPIGYNLTPINITGSLFNYEFTVPDNAVYIMIKVGDGKVFDENKGMFWDILIRTNDSLDIKEANYYAALSYMSSFGKNLSRIPDFKNAVLLFKRENELYPDNLKSEIALMSLNFELGSTDNNTYENHLQNLLSKIRVSIENEAEIEMIIKALRAIGKNERADEIRMRFIRNYPDSKLAQEYYFEMLSQVDDFDEFIDKSISFLKKYPNSDYSEKLNLAIIQSYIQVNKYKELIDLTKNSESTIPEFYFQMSENLIKNKKFIDNLNSESRFKDAELLADKGFMHISETKNNSGMTPNELAKLKELKYIRYLEIKSEISNQSGKISEHDSLNNLLYLRINDLNNSEVSVLSDYYYKRGIYNKSLLITEYDYLDNIETDSLNVLNKLSYQMIYPNGNYNNYIDSLENVKTNILSTLFRNMELSKNIELPTLKSLDKSVFSTKVFKGKILLFYTFSYWCDACWDSFNELEDIYLKYKNNENLVVIPVILWNKDTKEIDETANFREKNKLEIPIYIDIMNEAYKNFSITGVPTFCIVGRDGNLKYRFEGIDNNKKTFYNVNYVIDKLLRGE